MSLKHWTAGVTISCASVYADLYLHTLRCFYDLFSNTNHSAAIQLMFWSVASHGCESLFKDIKDSCLISTYTNHFSWASVHQTTWPHEAFALPSYFSWQVGSFSFNLHKTSWSKCFSCHIFIVQGVCQNFSRPYPLTSALEHSSGFYTVFKNKRVGSQLTKVGIRVESVTRKSFELEWSEKRLYIGTFSCGRARIRLERFVKTAGVS